MLSLEKNIDKGNEFLCFKMPSDHEMVLANVDFFLSLDITLTPLKQYEKTNCDDSSNK